ncbi:MAG: hypothetical protein HQL60_09255, partial [Magnetococcales bacterium]|nr:hypothetical protein [Magnetococcales bacterium]
MTSQSKNVAIPAAAKISLPTTPSKLDLMAADDNGASNSDNITSQTSSLTISGSGGVTGNTLVLFDDKDNNGVIDSGEGLVTTSVTGLAWSADIGLTLGTHAIKAIQKDAVGNSSKTSTAIKLTIVPVLAAPTGLDLDAGDDSGLSNSDNITKQTRTLTISGSGADKAVLTLFDDKNNNGVVDKNESLGTLSVATAGKWSKDISLAAGSHSIRAIQKSGASVSVASDVLLITVDTTAPTVPSSPDLDANDDDGDSNSDNYISNRSGLTFSGSGDIGASITLFVDKNNNKKQDANEVSLDSQLVGKDGRWRSSDLNLAIGSHSLVAIQTDAAGNSSPVSSPLNLSIIPHMPATTILSLVPTQGTEANAKALSVGVSTSSWNPTRSTAPTTVTYSFPTELADYMKGTVWDNDTFVPFDTAQQEAMRAALADIASLANITFEEADGTTTSGEIRFGTVRLDSKVGGQAYWPNYFNGSPSNIGGDGMLNNAIEHNSTPSAGSPGYLTLIHEIGHAIGLKHPFEAATDNTTILPTVDDNKQLTVMSYTEQPKNLYLNSELGEDSNYSYGYTNWHVGGYMLYDVSMLQQLYGANTATRIDDTEYKWVAGTPLQELIWDGGGTDTITASDWTLPCLIDLRPGHFSSIGLFDPLSQLPATVPLS